MNIDLIDIEFRKVIAETRAYKKLGITHSHQKILRNHLRKGVFISMDKKIRLLQRYGWKQDEFIYTRQHMADFAKFILQQSKAAQSLGPHYLLEKFLQQP